MQANIDASGLRALGEICSYGSFPSGKFIFTQGDDAQNFYIILKGAVNITINVKALRGTGEESVPAATRHVGDSFGVAALVYNAAERKYSAQASERCLCLVIQKTHFKKFLATKPSLESALMLSTKEFLLKRYAAMNVPIFGHIDDNLRAKAASLASFAHFDKDQVIYKQGGDPHAFYVVLHGEVSMVTEAVEGAPAPDVPETSFVQRESRKIAESFMVEKAERVLTVGQHFGEVGVLLPTTPCIATTTARSACTLLALESSAFIALFGSDAGLISEMQIKLLRNGCTLKAILAHPKGRPLFEKHIKGEYSDEHVKFYDATASYLERAHADDADAAAMLKDANTLIDEYVLDGSSSQVNIPSNMCKKITAWRKGDVQPASEVLEDLAAAQNEVYTLMARDNFSRFTKTPVTLARLRVLNAAFDVLTDGETGARACVSTQAFADLLVEIGSYDASVTSLVSNDDLTMLVQDGEGLAQAHLSA